MFGTRKWLGSLSLLVILSYFLAACGGASTPPTGDSSSNVAPTSAPAEQAPAEPTAVAAEPTDASSSGGAASSDEVITIEYWQYNFASRITAIDELIAQFEAENPNIKVVHNSDIPYEQFRDKIAASVPANAGPDVVALFYGWVPAWVDAGYLVPLPEDSFSEARFKSEFTPLVEGGKFEGKYWAVPTAVRTITLLWNKDLFEQAGLDPEKPPQTLDEFYDYAVKLTQRDGDNITVQGFAPEMTGQAHHWFREVLVRQFGGQPFSEDGKTITWNSPEGCQAFTWLTNLETEAKTGSNDLFDGATQAFLKGQLAMHIDGSFRLGTIASDAPDLNFGVAELPVGANGVKSTFGSYWANGITKRAASDPKRYEASVKFLEFITSPQAGAMWVKAVGELPAQLEAANDPELLTDPKLGAFVAGLGYAHATFFADESKERQILIDAYDAVRLAGANPCEALNDAAAANQEIYDTFWSGR
jgi:multiple sugar transport system substrate-binding protein